jgi:hypothetical protein
LEELRSKEGPRRIAEWYQVNRRKEALFIILDEKRLLRGHPWVELISQKDCDIKRRAGWEDIERISLMVVSVPVFWRRIRPRCPDLVLEAVNCSFE